MQAIGITPSGTWSSFHLPMIPQPFSIFSLLSGKSRKVSDGPQSTVLRYRLGTEVWAWCLEKWALSLSYPLIFSLLDSQRQFYFQSSPPESQPQILFQNFSFWDEVVSREVTWLPSCCWKTTLILPRPLLSALRPSLLPQRLLLNRQGTQGYWESCFEEPTNPFKSSLSVNMLWVGDMKEPGLHDILF